jgi:hypothetical protein
LAPRARTLGRIGLIAVLMLVPSFLRADGGAIRLSQKSGGYRIAVFTSPTPLRAGLVDVSVLVQDAVTGECVPEAQVTVRLKRPDSARFLTFPATSAAATNRLFQAAFFELPGPGRWNAEVAVEGPHGPARIEFGLEADEALPRWLELGPWFAWPTLVVGLFAVHRMLVRRRLSPPPALPAPPALPVRGVN